MSRVYTESEVEAMVQAQVMEATQPQATARAVEFLRGATRPWAYPSYKPEFSLIGNSFQVRVEGRVYDVRVTPAPKP